jgi:NAD+ diphosphatase
VAETTLDWLALSRGALDRAGERRRDDAWLAQAWADARTRIFAIDQGKVLIRSDPALVLLGTDQAPEGERYLLGVDEDGVAYFAVAAPLPAVEGTEPAGLRTVGALLSDRDAGLLTQAVALQNWHETHGYCPKHGAPMAPASAGHTRVCPVDGAEHFPRTDPAVIMLVHDDERMLLASSANWPMTRASVLAGFVEVGESLEQAVAREVYEEVGIRVHDCRYLGSQPWPLPRSLMLGFFARADEGQELRVDGEEIKSARWYSRTELLAATESGELRLPGRISIARQLIERWYGGELPGGW